MKPQTLILLVIAISSTSTAIPLQRRQETLQLDPLMTPASPLEPLATSTSSIPETLGTDESSATQPTVTSNPSTEASQTATPSNDPLSSVTSSAPEETKSTPTTEAPKPSSTTEAEKETTSAPKETQALTSTSADTKPSETASAKKTNDQNAAATKKPESGSNLQFTIRPLSSLGQANFAADTKGNTKFGLSFSTVPLREVTKNVINNFPFRRPFSKRSQEILEE